MLLLSLLPNFRNLQCEERSRKSQCDLRLASKSPKVGAVRKERKKKLLFDEPTTKPVQRSNSIKQSNGVKITASSSVCSQIYSQSSNNGKSFNKQCNLASYFGPKENYKSQAKDYEKILKEHKKEFEKLEEESTVYSPPKYVIQTQHIYDKFSDIVTHLCLLYAAQNEMLLKAGVQQELLLDETTLNSFVKSEFTRIGITYFSNLEGFKVAVSEAHKGMEKNVKKVTLLTEKYQENYISNLIDISKSSLRGYLYKFVNEDHIEDFMVNVEEDRNNFCQEMTKNINVRKSRRLIKQGFQNSYHDGKNYAGVFISNECFKPKEDQEANTAFGNTGEQVIRTCCQELGFKRILINSITMKRTQANLMKFVIEGTQSERINFINRSIEHEKQNKTVLLFEDIDSVFPDEVGFYSGLVRCLENSKVPIIMTSHKSYEDSEIIRRCEKKGIRIKHIKTSKDHRAALKLKIRLHIIVLFECLIDKYMKEYVENDKENTQTEIDIDLDQVPIDVEELSHEEITNQYAHITTLLEYMDFDLKKVLSLLGAYKWDDVLASLNAYNMSPSTMPSRNDILFKDQIFSSTNPNLKLTYDIFNEVLTDLEKIDAKGAEPKQESEDEGKVGTQSQTPIKDDEFPQSLEAYQKFIENVSDFCYLKTKQTKYEENIKSKNICDVNITKMDDYQKHEISEVMDEFFLGTKVAPKKIEQKVHVKRTRSQNSDEYEKYLTTIAENTLLPRMTMGDSVENNNTIPYFCYIAKEGGLSRYKNKLNCTASLYGALDEARMFHQLNLKLLYSNVFKGQER